MLSKIYNGKALLSPAIEVFLRKVYWSNVKYLKRINPHRSIWSLFHVGLQLLLIKRGAPEALYNNPLSYVNFNDGLTEYEVGCVVEKGDFKALCGGIEKYRLEIDDIMKQRRMKCREWALEHFDKDKMFNDYIQLYNSMIYK